MNTPSQPGRTSGGQPPWEPPSPDQLAASIPAYEVTEILGRGGMGAVYKARQKSLKRWVAIKVLPLVAADDELQFAERFRNEAETMAQMNHPSIVNVYDFGETNDGLLYIVMEFVDGTDVHKMIHGNGMLSGEYALAITAHVCDALAYAHARGVIHRDIKPANILIDQEGNVKVADFGLAKMSHTDYGLTRSNVAMGTPDYVAPEVLSYGMVADHRADLYAVGVMLYQMLTGEVPRGLFKLPSQKGIDADPRFDDIICKAMEPDRDERYQSATDVRAALEVILTTAMPKEDEAAVVPEADEAVKQKTQGTRAPGDRVRAPATKSSSTGLWLGLGGLAALIAVAAFLILGGKSKPGSESASAKSPSSSSLSQTATPPPVKENGIPPSTLPARPEPVTGKAIDLLPLVDVKRDTIAGEWSREGGDLLVKATKPDTNGTPRLQLPYQPPEEYDFEVEFTPESGTNMVGQALSAYQHSFAWFLDAQLNAGNKAGFNEIDGVSVANRTDGTTMRAKFLTNGQRHRSTVEVRRTGVRALLDGDVQVTWGNSPKSYERLEIWKNEKMRDALNLGLIAYDRGVRFHKATVREITGTGKVDAATSNDASPVITNWQDVTGTVMEQAKAKPGFTIEGDLIAWTGDKQNPPHITVTLAGRNDYSIRLKHFEAGQINVRMNEKGFVYVQAAPAGLRINRWMKGVVAPVSLIASQPIPFSYDKGEPHDLTVTVQGSTIRAWLDGQLMGTVEDTTFAEGTGAVAFVSYGKVQKVEITELSAMPATAGTEGASAQDWQPLFTQPGDFGNDAPKVEIRDGWLFVNTAKTHYAPTDSIDGAIRATLRFHPKDTANLTARANDGAPWGKEAYACSVFITPDGKTATLMSTMEKIDGEKPWKRHDFPLPAVIRQGEELALELRVEGDQIAVLFNGKKLGSVTHTFPGTKRRFGIMTSTSGVSEFRDVAWQKLE